jgi:transposase
MTPPLKQGTLFPEVVAPEGVAIINERCLVRTRNGFRVVIAAGIPIAQYELGDRMSEACAMVNLVDQGWADQNDVARVFGCAERTLRRYQRRFEEGGLPALGRGVGYPKGRPRLHVSRARRVKRLKEQSLSNREIAASLGVTEKAVRKILKRMGWTRPEPSQLPLIPEEKSADPNLSAFSSSPLESLSLPPSPAADPNLSAFSSAEPAAPPSIDTDPADRRFDRLMAYLGLLDDATPLFRSGARVQGAGVLLAIPALVSSGVFACAREVYGSIGPAFYGLRTTITALSLMALLRIKRAEGLKEHPPDTFGRILGLDRAPEVKTLRRKLSRLAGFGRAVRFGRLLAERRVEARGSAMGFLYADGHVRVYHGKEALPKAHVAQMRLPMPATTDYWVNDAVGEPLFVVTAEANAGLVKMLPALLAEVRALVGERRVTIVFDRGGWSPKLFQTIISSGFDLLTYRKGRSRRVPLSRFSSLKGRIGEATVKYDLADQGVRLLGGALRLRQVTLLTKDGHQTPIITSRRDLPAIEVAYRMFERWRQENFFKYLCEEYALDALVEYATTPDDPTREVPNPKWKAADAELREARAELQGLEAEYGKSAFRNPESRRSTMRGFKIAHGESGKKMRAAMKRCRDLEMKRAATPRRIPVGRIVEGPVVMLSTEQKHLTNLMKMVAYQAESDLARLVAPHYRRAADEGRTLIQSVLTSAADIKVGEKELRILVAPLSSPHRTRALAALCRELTAASVPFPGTDLILRYGLAKAENAKKADKS